MALYNKNHPLQNYLTFELKGDIQYVAEGDIISIEGIKSKVNVPITKKNVHPLTEVLNKTFDRRKNITISEEDITKLKQISLEYPFYRGSKLSLKFMHVGYYTLAEGREIEQTFPVEIQISSNPESISKAARIIEKYYLMDEGLGRFFLAQLTGLKLIKSNAINR